MDLIQIVTPIYVMKSEPKINDSMYKLRSCLHAVENDTTYTFFSEIISIFHMNQVSHVIHGFRQLSAQAKRIERLALSPLKLAKFMLLGKR